MTGSEITTHTPADRYIRHLAAAAHSADPALARLRRWRPDGVVDVDVIRLTSAADDEQWIAWALAGKLFASWHSGRAGTRYGRPGTGLGHGLRSLGATGSRGPRNPGAVRLLDRLIAAGSDVALADTLDAIGRQLRTVDYPPHWATIATEIEAWRNPATRTDIRVLWARQFHTYQPAAVEPAADES
ncbi:type I-E CRISPR-associated protein Cse2/CasB [Rhodococcus marinonascens]|uniref:type I-E CRISPR-associated protein Cse2/CasB n=1 Tax=Rhodococcus marinonascens TaxID=38311 RepID=UPI00093367E5|nr:type I-E CRISPR-associated protein Cse2/CasB [Rhodococcus marinonascens]